MRRTFHNMMAGMLCCLAFLILTGCNQRGNLVTEELTMKEISGKYELTHLMFNETLNERIRAQVDHSYIELKPDGSLYFQSVPIVEDPDNGSYKLQDYRTGNGSYTIAPMGSTPKSVFYGLYIDCGDLPDPIDSPRLRKDGDTLILSFDYFDGDFIQRMAFTRTED